MGSKEGDGSRDLEGKSPQGSCKGDSKDKQWNYTSGNSIATDDAV